MPQCYQNQCCFSWVVVGSTLESTLGCDEGSIIPSMKIKLKSLLDHTKNPENLDFPNPENT